MAKLYVGTIGTVLSIDMGQDVSAATAVMLKVRKPDGTQDEWTAEADEGDNDKIVYTTAENDLDQAGEYLIQPYLTFTAWEGLCDTVRIDVSPPFDLIDEMPAEPEG